MKSFHKAYASLTQEVSADTLKDLQFKTGLYKEDGLNMFRGYVSEDVIAIVIATRIGNVLIHQMHPDNNSLIVVTASEKLKSFMMIDINKTILSSEQVLRITGANPDSNAASGDDYFINPNISIFIDSFYTIEQPNLSLNVCGRYVDNAGNIVDIIYNKNVNDGLVKDLIFSSLEQEEYYPDGRHLDNGEAVSPLLSLDLMLEI
jgi:hypothetical protein